VKKLLTYHETMLKRVATSSGSVDPS